MYEESTQAVHWFCRPFTPVTETGSSDTLKHVQEDVDGPGGGNPDIDTVVPEHGKNYDISLSLFDKTKIPFANITTEIVEESNVHRFYFQPDSGTGITISDPDKDIDGMTLGLLNKLNPVQPTTGHNPYHCGTTRWWQGRRRCRQQSEVNHRR